MCFEIHLRSSQTTQNQKKNRWGLTAPPGPPAEIQGRCARTEVTHKCTFVPPPPPLSK